jgi:hypothetical protein
LESTRQWQLARVAAGVVAGQAARNYEPKKQPKC